MRWNNAYTILPEIFEEETPLGKWRVRVEDNIKMVYKIRRQSRD
jgi:hypothetical protein